MGMIFKDFENKWVKKGREQGIEQGIERGLEQGIEQGIEQEYKRITEELRKQGIDYTPPPPPERAEKD